MAAANQKQPIRWTAPSSAEPYRDKHVIYVSIYVLYVKDSVKHIIWQYFVSRISLKTHNLQCPTNLSTT